MTLEDRAREFLRNEDGVLGDVFKIMAVFAEVLVAEEREACAKVAEATNDCCECLHDDCCKGQWCVTAKAIRARNGKDA